jgi:hypothetical protein
MHCNTTSTGESQYLSVTTLAQELEADFVKRYGFVISSDKLQEALGFPSAAAVRKALEFCRVPVPVFRMPHRRGRFVLARDLAQWLAQQSRAQFNDARSNPTGPLKEDSDM